MIRTTSETRARVHRVAHNGKLGLLLFAACVIVIPLLFAMIAFIYGLTYGLITLLYAVIGGP